MVNAGHRQHQERKAPRKGPVQAEQQTPSDNILMGLLRAVPFLQHGAEPEQLITEATLVTSKSPHSQKLDHIQYSQQYIPHEESCNMNS